MDEIVCKEQALHGLMVLALALQWYHREHGAFPESAGALVPEYLTALPIDPFGKGEPLRYRRESGHAAGATVWSVGHDGVDDGGAAISCEGCDLRGDIVSYIPDPGPQSK